MSLTLLVLLMEQTVPILEHLKAVYFFKANYSKYTDNVNTCFGKENRSPDLELNVRLILRKNWGEINC
jgi:hypothetical protein